MEEMELVKKSDTFKMIIPKEVEDKIRYVCKEIWDDEWSGILFYTSKGEFEDGTLTIRCIDIYIMDIGTQTYTEFAMSPNVINYMADNPDLLNCQIGLIHSHNHMNTFFSNTDIDTLKEEGKDRNHFVSLIVNNKGSYTAAITRKVNTIKNIIENSNYLSFGNNKISFSKKNFIEEDKIEWFYLNVQFEENNFILQESIGTRLEEIKKNKDSKKENKGLFKYEKGDGLPFINHNKFEITDYNDFQHFGIKFDKDIIKFIVLQLITGSVIIPNKSKIDVNKWVNSMESLYERRFGDGQKGMDLFKTWAENYVEFLCWYTEDESLKNIYLDKDDLVMICANNIIEELKKLPKNKYLEGYISILEGYLM